MTVIAYRDGIIAADTLTSGGGMKMGYKRKIAKNKDGDVFGSSGVGGWCSAIRQWFEEGEEGPVPTIAQEATGDDTGKAMIIRAAQPTIVQMLFSNPRFYPDTFTIRSDVGMAIGSGWAEAMGAMHAGADALGAVRAAIALDEACGGSVDWERLGWE